MAAALRLHDAHNGLGQADERQGVDLKDGADRRVVVQRHVAADDLACVVDQHIDAPKGLDGVIHDVLGGALIRQVGRKGDDPCAIAGDFVLHFRQAFRVAVYQQQVRLFAGEGMGDGTPNASGGPRHDDGLVGQGNRVHLILAALPHQVQQPQQRRNAQCSSHTFCPSHSIMRTF